MTESTELLYMTLTFLGFVAVLAFALKDTFPRLKLRSLILWIIAILLLMPLLGLIR